MSNEYADDLRAMRSLLIVTSLQQRDDLNALKKIRSCSAELDWSRLDDLVINADVWRYAVEERGYDPKLVFCHPDVLLWDPSTSLYYRGLCALSLKEVGKVCGSVKALESSRSPGRLDSARA